ncbi:family 10 glycosylhydrolase [Paenibacillus sp. R14(2021)]|uniref:family 10 glycosylhydrolase n=1 Tax=Paenibacillus sp. R14(2021) TaxID=2859228 RepID=UPI001C611686|nr:family 10 glycosylhydrolase [Paenibacillus sp. R14(2021)]
MRLGKWAALTMMLLVYVLTALAQPAHAADRSIGIYLDGRKLASDVSPFIVPKVNVTMVPLRVISEGIGASVAWTPQTRTVTIDDSSVTIELKAGAKNGLVNGSSVALEASVQNTQGRIMVPLRFVGEQLGLLVDWSQSDRTISLTSPGYAPPTEPDGSPGSNPGSGGTSPGTGEGNGGSHPGSGPGASSGLRGAWVSTVFNLDWPTAASYGKQDQQKQEFTKLLDELQHMGLNAVFVQVRPAGDALYPSQLVPWSKVLTGTQGKDPGYDPLAFMIEETHKRGMQFHAWFNPFRANTDAKIDTLAANHVAKQHPEWIVNSGGTIYINPGIPEARQHIIDAVMEVVSRYDIDGVHLDDYFYPSGGTFDDNAAFLTYGLFKNKADWRRNNINLFVQQLGSAIHDAKPAVKFGISPFGVWRNQSVDPTGSATKAGVTAYDNMYADVRTWIKSGWLDYVIPQIYWSLSFPAARYDTLTSWWSNEVRGTGVSLYIGHSPYKLGTNEAGWQDAHEITRQLDDNKQHPEVAGDVFFSAKDLRRNPLGIADVLRAYYGG